MSNRIKTRTVWSIRWLLITPFGTHRIRNSHSHSHSHPIHSNTIRTDEIELNERLHELHCAESHLAGGQLRVCSTEAMFMRRWSHALATARAHFGWPFSLLTIAVSISRSVCRRADSILICTKIYVHSTIGGRLIASDTFGWKSAVKTYRATRPLPHFQRAKKWDWER